MRLGHIATVIVNADHSIGYAMHSSRSHDAVVGNGATRQIKRQRITDQINGAMIFTRANLVNVHGMASEAG